MNRVLQMQRAGQRGQDTSEESLIKAPDEAYLKNRFGNSKLTRPLRQTKGSTVLIGPKKSKHTAKEDVQ